jgi:CubicO group peptidase (beta-lactamase class C family)
MSNGGNLCWSMVSGPADRAGREVTADTLFPVASLTKPMAATLLRRKPTGDPGVRYRYSGAAFGVLTDVIETAGGAPFGEQLAKGILEPCAMSDTTSALRMLNALAAPPASPGQPAAPACSDDSSSLRQSPTPPPGSSAPFPTTCDSTRRWLRGCS